tara:strand:+ start:43 stop:249 length:207 start_codon:yes stop_codon:yes gene_type:complete
MSLEQLATCCLEMIREFPAIENKIKDLFQLAVDEIEQGESEPHECQMCYMAIEGEIQEYLYIKDNESI